MFSLVSMLCFNKVTFFVMAGFDCNNYCSSAKAVLSVESVLCYLGPSTCRMVFINEV